jgi:hypothetical protein
LRFVARGIVIIIILREDASTRVSHSFSSSFSGSGRSNCESADEGEARNRRRRRRFFFLLTTRRRKKSRSVPFFLF